MLHKPILSFWVFYLICYIPLPHSTILIILKSFRSFRVSGRVLSFFKKENNWITSRRINQTPSLVLIQLHVSDHSTFPSSAFILSFSFLNSVMTAKIFPGNLRNKNLQDAIFYSKFISIINLYLFRVALLLIIRRYYSVYTVIVMCHAFMLAGCANISRCTVYKTLHFPESPKNYFS